MSLRKPQLPDPVPGADSGRPCTGLARPTWAGVGSGCPGRRPLWQTGCVSGTQQVQRTPGRQPAAGARNPYGDVCPRAQPPTKVALGRSERRRLPSFLWGSSRVSGAEPRGLDGELAGERQAPARGGEQGPRPLARGRGRGPGEEAGGSDLQSGCGRSLFVRGAT